MHTGSEIDGKNINHGQYYLYASLEHGVSSNSVDEDVKLNDFPDEVMESARKKTAIPSIKLQKKGSAEIFIVPIPEVGIWDDFLGVLKKYFPASNSEPQVTSFDGNLITSSEDYKGNLKPGLHLIVYFPPTIVELSESLNTLFFDNISSVFFIPTSSSNPQAGPAAPVPSSSQLANYLNPPSPKLAESITPTKYHLQPPNIYFAVNSPTAISITLTNSAFQDSTFYPTQQKYKHLGEIGALAFQNHAVKYLYPTISPSLDSNFFTDPNGFEGPSKDYTIIKECSGLPTQPSDDRILPPWSPFSIYKEGSKEHQMDAGEVNPYRVVSGGLFPVTSFDLFAQSQRTRVMCSIGWDVIASPIEGLKDIVSDKVIPNLSWAVKDGEQLENGYTRTSEKRVYANYEGPLNTENDNREGRSVGWWMVGPGKLPTGFSGEVGEHVFLLNGVVGVAAHLGAFMKRCGIAQYIIEDFVKYWTQNLERSESELTGRNAMHDGFPQVTNTPKLILLKFLPPRDLRNLLPLLITPAPHRTVRLFVVFRVIEQWELETEGIDPCGDFETEVDRVLGGIGSCGGGWDCGHRGFKVAEVGGVRVFGNDDGRQEGDEITTVA